MRVVIDQYLDCRTLACPLPIVRISRAIKAMQPGQVLQVQAADPAFPADLDAWLSTRSDTLLSLETIEGEQCALIQKSDLP